MYLLVGETSLLSSYTTDSPPRGLVAWRWFHYAHYAHYAQPTSRLKNQKTNKQKNKTRGASAYGGMGRDEWLDATELTDARSRFTIDFSSVNEPCIKTVIIYCDAPSVSCLTSAIVSLCAIESTVTLYPSYLGPGPWDHNNCNSKEMIF